MVEVKPVSVTAANESGPSGKLPASDLKRVLIRFFDESLSVSSESSPLSLAAVGMLSSPHAVSGTKNNARLNRSGAKK